MYLSDNAKRNLKWVIVLWNEHGRAPSFKEFDDDPRTPRANCLAHDFGSYSEAIKRAEYYLTHPELLEIKPVVPPPKPANEAKKKAKSSSRKATVISVQKITATEKPAPKPEPKPEPKTPQPSPKPTLTWKTTTVEPPPPAPTPTLKPKGQAPKTPPKPPKAPEPQRIPEKPSEPPKTADFTPQECEEIMNAYAKKPTKIISYYPCRVVLISEDDYLTHESTAAELREDLVSFYSIPRGGFYAKVKSSTAKYSSHKVKNEMVSYDVAIMRNLKTPYLFRDGKAYSFPPPSPGVLLLVTRDVIEAAKISGRTTGDLVYPTAYYEESNICFCCELGCI